MQNQTSTQCLGCGSEAYMLIGKSEHTITEIHAQKKFVQPPFSLQECTVCGLVYKHPILSKEQIDDYYTSIDFSVWKYNNALNPPEKKVFDFTTEKYKNKTKILDFGCSVGRFLSHLPENFNKYGYDLDTRSLKIAAESGIKTISFNQIKDNKFDIIVMFDVFEHLANPTDIIEYLISSLNTKGLLVISTGTSDSKIFKIQKHRFWYIDFMQHFILINGKYINYVSHKFNLNLIKSIPTPHANTSKYENITSRIRFYTAFFISPKIGAKLNILLPKIGAKLNRNRYPGVSGENDHVVLFLEKN